MKLQQTSLILVSASVLSAVSAKHIIASDAFVLDDDAASKVSGLSIKDKERLAERGLCISTTFYITGINTPNPFNLQKVIAQPDTSSAENFDKNSDAPKNHMSVGRVWKLLTSVASGVFTDLEDCYSSITYTIQDAWDSYRGFDVYEYSEEDVDSVLMYTEPGLKHNDQFFTSGHSMRDDNANGIENDYENDGDSSCKFYEIFKDHRDYSSENLKKEQEINSKKISSVLKHNSSLSMFSNYANLVDPILYETNIKGKFSVVFVPSNDSIISLENNISQNVGYGSAELRRVCIGTLYDFYRVYRQKPVRDVDFRNIKYVAQHRLVKQYRRKILRAHMSIMDLAAGGASSKPDIHTNIKRLENGQLFRLKSGSTGIISRDAGSGILTVNVLNKLNTIYSANITEKIEAENGVIYVVDDYLDLPLEY